MGNGTFRWAMVLLLSSSIGYSAQLKKDTLNAWDAYLFQQIQLQQSQQRSGVEQNFLWIDRNADVSNDVMNGQIAVEPASDPNPIRVPSGLIHHWIAAVYIPGATVADVLSVMRDYAHYRDYFQPGVADAWLEKRTDYHDEFSIRLSNSSVLSSTSLVGKYITNFVRLDGRRWYSVSETQSLCEIKNFGQSNEKRFPAGVGSGYIWRLFSMARMEDRNHGVVLEVEAIALSRDIPGALHWFVDPIVRRISRDSLEKSLQQTSETVQAHLRDCTADHSIIEAANCAQHADHSDFRPQKLAVHSFR